MSLLNTIAQVKQQTTHLLKRNSPAILTALGVTGTVTTAVLAVKATFEAAEVLERHDSDLSFKEKAKIVWPLYIHTTASGVITVVCIVSSAHINSRRIATAYSLLGVSERAFEEYQDKVREIMGDKKEKDVRDEIAQDRVNATPPSDGVVLLASPGNVMVMEAFTGRYFHSDMESLRRAENNVNARLIHEMYVTLSDLYDELGLPNTTNSDQTGWESGRPVEFSYSAALHEGNPCIVVDYNYVKSI